MAPEEFFSQGSLWMPVNLCRKSYSNTFSHCFILYLLAWIRIQHRSGSTTPRVFSIRYFVLFLLLLVKLWLANPSQGCQNLSVFLPASLEPRTGARWLPFSFSLSFSRNTNLRRCAFFTSTVFFCIPTNLYLLSCDYVSLVKYCQICRISCPSCQ